MRRLIGASLLGLAAAAAAQAQTGTHIVPDTGPDSALATQVSRNGSTWAIDGGRVAGANLFHSFATFDLGAGDVARWIRGSGDPAAIANVINRVTGGDPSDIYGTLDSSALPNADFFFINPAGIVFGEGAQVNVPAAAYFSTAGELRFASGPAFRASAPDGSTLSVAAPEAFGFVGGEAGIAIAGAAIYAPAAALSLSARDIAVTDSSIVAGRLDLAAVGGSGGEVRLADPPAIPASGSVRLVRNDIAAFPNQPFDGGIGITGADVLVEGGLPCESGCDRPRPLQFGSLITVSTSDRPAGDIVLRAGSLRVDHGATVWSLTGTDRDTGSILVEAGTFTAGEGVDILTFTAAAGDAGDLSFSTTLFETRGLSAVIRSATTGSGSAGDILIDAEQVRLRDVARIRTATQGAGDAGDIRITAPDMLIDAILESDADGASSGHGGDIFLTADRLVTTDAAFISSASFGPGDAGDIRIEADVVELRGSVRSETIPDARYNPLIVGGEGGDIVISGRELVIHGGVASDTLGAGDAGDILLSGDHVVLHGFLNSGARSRDNFLNPGSAGDIRIEAASFEAGPAQHDGDPAIIFTSTLGGLGSGGDISIDAATIALDSTFILSQSRTLVAPRAVGDAGNIRIEATSLSAEDSQISSSTFAGGDAGEVAIVAETVTLSGSSVSSQSANVIAGAPISSHSDGGIVRIDADTLTLLDASAISTSGEGDGDAGDILLTVRRLSLDNSDISSVSSGTGPGGDIRINSPDSLEVSGRSSVISSAAEGFGTAGAIALHGRDVAITGVTLDSSTVGQFTGDGGDLTVTADRSIAIGAFLFASTNGFGDAGSILIAAPSISLDDSQLQSSNLALRCIGESCIPLPGAGEAGTVTLMGGDSVTIARSSIRTDTIGTGPGGSIHIASGGMLAISGEINAETTGAGAAGTITFEAPVIAISDSRIITESAPPACGASCLRFPLSGDGGDVTITAGESLTVTRSRISADTSTGGDAGAVTLRGPTIVTDEAEISSGSNGNDTVECTPLACAALQPAGDAGDIALIARDTLIIGHFSVVSSGTLAAGDAGNISLAADTIEVSGGSQVASDAATIGFLGQAGDAGTIVIDARTFLLAGIDLDGPVVFGIGSSIDTANLGNGAGGNILITAESVSLRDHGRITSSTFGEGPAGNVEIVAGELTMGPSTDISSESLFDCLAFACEGLGRAGSVTIRGGHVSLEGYGFETASISSATHGAGQGGSVTIQADDLTLVGDGALISSETLFGSGDAGNVTIAADDVRIEAGAITSDAGFFSTGDAGSVTIDAGNIVLTGSGRISSSTEGAGHAGDVTISAVESLTVANSRISSDTSTGGDAGAVILRAATIATDEATISSESTGRESADCIPSRCGPPSSGGDAGDVSLIARDMLVIGNSTVVTSRTLGAGDAGSISLAADKIEVSGGSHVSSDAVTVGIAGQGGDAGTIVIDARSFLLAGIDLDGPIVFGIGSSISTENLGNGAGGDILITAESVNLRDHGQITSSTFGEGPAGNVEIVAGELTMGPSTAINSESHFECLVADCEGLGRAGSVTIRGGNVRLEGHGFDRASISSATHLTGEGGSVTIQADGLALVGDGALISSETLFGSGDAGNVTIAADDVRIEGGAITTDAFFFSTGDAGSVTVDAGTLLLTGVGRISSSTTGAGDAGAIHIRAGRIALQGGRISSSADPFALGASGSLDIAAAESLDITGGGSIVTQSNNANPAGLIFVEAPRLAIRGAGSEISSANLSPEGGDAGLIRLTVGGGDRPMAMLAEGGRISTGSAAGSAGDIELAMSPDSLLILQGTAAEPAVIETSSGPGTGGRILIASPLAIVANGSSIEALGESGGANVRIESPFFIASSDRANAIEVAGVLEFDGAIADVSAGTIEADLQALDASGVLRGQCTTVRATGRLSQLGMRPVGPYVRSAPAPGTQPPRLPDAAPESCR